MRCRRSPLKVEDHVSLYEAASMRRTDLIRSRAAEGIGTDDLDALDSGGWTALHSAAYAGALDAVRELLALGADPDTGSSRESETALHLASRRGFAEVVVALVECGASTEERRAGSLTPLHVAALEGHPCTVRALLHAGAQVDARDDEGWTPLHFASGSREHYPTTNVEGPNDSCPRCCRDSGIEEVVRLLLEWGADPGSRPWDDIEGTPLYLAAASGAEGTVRLLIDAGAPVGEQSPRKAVGTFLGAAASETAKRGGSDADEESGGVRLNNWTLGLDTPLHAACRNLHEGCVWALLLAGADEAAPGARGETPDKVIEEEEEMGERGQEKGYGSEGRWKVRNRILTALRRAPANRAWYRRGWLVLIRHHCQGYAGHRRGAEAGHSGGRGTVAHGGGINDTDTLFSGVSARGLPVEGMCVCVCVCVCWP
ncbi:unnamed protein product [Discosporangium mesarthrocarpum]